MIHVKTSYSAYQLVTGLWVLLLVLLTNCSTARIEQAKHVSNVSTLEEGEAIVVLARKQDRTNETEQDFLECLNEELEDVSPQLVVFPTQEFMDSLFPWFEPRIAPANPDSLFQLLAQKNVAKIISSLGIRHLIWLDGDTDEVDKGGNIACTVTPFGGGCFGLSWWDKESIYEASVWDLKLTQSVGKVSADVSGTSYMPALILPIPLIARTQNTACEELAGQLKDLMGFKK